MKKTLIAVGVFLVVASASGCFGPQKLTRQFDDWLNQGYADSPWLFGNTAAWTFILGGQVVTRLLDGLLANPVDFWGVSAWPFGRGGGTPFNHRGVAGAKGP